MFSVNIDCLTYTFKYYIFKYSFPLWFIIVKVKVSVAQACPTLCDPMDYSLPGFSAHGILQARILEWVAFPLEKADLPDPS